MARLRPRRGDNRKLASVGYDSERAARRHAGRYRRDNMGMLRLRRRRRRHAELRGRVAAAADALRQGVSAELGLRGVIGLAPITCLADALTDGLSDHHDAAINFLWRAGECRLLGLQRRRGRVAASVR